ncbi:hypothetical protein DFJ43DRAFT_1070151 [Lentinula guzmanii]|uniref:Uncharacterized protein n=1 Tax=Lentinula guzmanii TaxID=2804957 RepID=A0AA38N2C8_9AGAR|nr:hypothetical protein DFJ43DRAFT_1070151 [Lentinula guzmanii]
MTMASNPPFVLHEYKHQHPERSQHGPRLPPIPDLRFEPSYLRSIQPYIRLRTLQPGHKSTVKKGADSKGRVDQEDGGTKQKIEQETVDVDWSQVLWVTARDQILSPLFQGALWALITFYFTPYSRRFTDAIVQHLPSRRS